MYAYLARGTDHVEIATDHVGEKRLSSTSEQQDCFYNEEDQLIYVEPILFQWKNRKNSSPDTPIKTPFMQLSSDRKSIVKLRDEIAIAKMPSLETKFLLM